MQREDFGLKDADPDKIKKARGVLTAVLTDIIESWNGGNKDPAALERARDAAGARDVKIGGGVSTVRQYLQAGLIDELHFALTPVLLGRSEAMFEGLDLPALGYRVMESTHRPRDERRARARGERISVRFCRFVAG